MEASLIVELVDFPVNVAQRPFEFTLNIRRGLSASWAAKEPALKNVLLNNEAMQKRRGRV